MNIPSQRRSSAFAVALRSDVGKVRSENQDFGLVSSPDSWDPAEGILMIVADGMGGHRGGATASRLAASTIQEGFLGARDGDTAAALVRAIEAANTAVFEESKRTVELRGMGTTVSALVVRGPRAWLAHVGDSRIYLLREGKLHQLTEDHSLVATMVKEGLITPEEAAVHPRRNVLQRSLGVATEVEVDHRDSIDIQAGDTFLLCSDGLHGFVPLDSIREALELPVEKAADRCVELAHAAGAPDNVTVIVCRAQPGDAKPRSSEATVEIPVGTQST